MQTIAAYDNDPKAVATHNANWEPVAQVADLTDWQALDIPDCDGIVAGPPCQDESVFKQLSHYSDKGRSSLYLATARIIARKKPAWAIIENVVPMTKSDEYKQASAILWDAGYWLTTYKMVHAAYGGYTTRERAFLVISKHSIPLPPPDLLRTGVQIAWVSTRAYLIKPRTYRMGNSESNTGRLSAGAGRCVLLFSKVYEQSSAPPMGGGMVYHYGSQQGAHSFVLAG